MITVNVYRDENGKINDVFVSGHSGYDENGKDIVCSAVSTAVLLTASLIEKICPKYSFVTDEKKVTMTLKLLESNDVSNIVIENLVDFLESLKENYTKYIKIKYIK